MRVTVCSPSKCIVICAFFVVDIPLAILFFFVKELHKYLNEKCWLLDDLDTFSWDYFDNIVAIKNSTYGNNRPKRKATKTVRKTSNKNEQKRENVFFLWGKK